MLLENKVAVVSGIGSGMGFEIARAFAREGADVVLAARSKDALDEFASRIEEESGRHALAVATDITDEAARQRLAEATAEHFGHVDVLVNNAAHGGNYKTLMDSRLDSWRKTMELNVFATLGLTQQIVPLMKGRDGRIIMINTTGSLRAREAGGAYGGSKAALAHITRCLAKELGPQGIRVNSIHPGHIMGEHWIEHYSQQAAARGISFDEIVAEVSSQHALRYVTDASEIAGTAVFLASDLAKPITGQSIVVDCGAD
jgi:NAD(P)-dependent dehydrogenase (short-subunit alcohol dehydrogenase family)